MWRFQFDLFFSTFFSSAFLSWAYHLLFHLLLSHTILSAFLYLCFETLFYKDNDFINFFNSLGYFNQNFPLACGIIFLVEGSSPVIGFSCYFLPLLFLMTKFSYWFLWNGLPSEWCEVFPGLAFCKRLTLRGGRAHSQSEHPIPIISGLSGRATYFGELFFANLAWDL